MGRTINNKIKEVLSDNSGHRAALKHNQFHITPSNVEKKKSVWLINKVFYDQLFT